MLDEALAQRLKTGQVTLQQGVDNSTVKIYRHFCHRDYSFGLCLLYGHTVTEVPVFFVFPRTAVFFERSFYSRLEA
jgi:hypothetical protein